ncbi:MAG: hypothetical protein ABJF01_17935 [bacterium]
MTRRATLFSRVAMAALVSAGMPRIGIAQSAIRLTAPEIRLYTNNPCTAPDISWALWHEHATGTKPTGGIAGILDCDASNYGSFTNSKQLLAAVAVYRRLLRTQDVRTVTFVGDDRHAYGAVAKGNTVAFGFDAGEVTDAGTVTSKNATPLVPASALMARGARRAVVMSDRKLVAHEGAEFFHGEGSWRGATVPGEIVVQFPSRWVKVGMHSTAARPDALPQRQRDKR